MIRIAQIGWFAVNIDSFLYTFSKSDNSSSSFIISGNFFWLFLDTLCSYQKIAYHFLIYV